MISSFVKASSNEVVKSCLCVFSNNYYTTTAEHESSKLWLLTRWQLHELAKEAIAQVLSRMWRSSRQSRRHQIPKVETSARWRDLEARRGVLFGGVWEREKIEIIKAKSTLLTWLS